MATTNDNWIPSIAIHPAELIRDEIKARGLKSKEMAALMGMPPSNLCRLLKEHRTITPLIANKLQDAFGNIPATFWLGLQAQYERDKLALERQSIEEQEAKNSLALLNSLCNLAELLKRWAIDAKQRASFLLGEILARLGLSRIENILQIEHSCAFNKSEKVGHDKRMMLTWVLLARAASLKVDVNGTFASENETALTNELFAVLNRNVDSIASVRRILSKYGIRFVIEEKVSKAPINGCSFFIGNVPCIALTLRLKRIDNLAFTLMHEVCHLFHHMSSNNLHVSMEDDWRSAMEQEANRYAADVLIPPAMWRTFPTIISSNPKIAKKQCYEWADEHGIQRKIALGRYAHETAKYYFANDGFEKIG